MPTSSLLRPKCAATHNGFEATLSDPRLRLVFDPSNDFRRVLCAARNTTGLRGGPSDYSDDSDSSRGVVEKELLAGG